MEGTIAIVGFWVFMILLVLRVRRPAGNSAELEQLRSRVQMLEQQVGSMSTRLVELSEGHDFTLKLLKEAPPKL